MKKPGSNVLRRELARSQNAGPHPDADLLTAFEEGTLSKRERDQLIEHLAVCAECRDVLNLAVSSAPESATNEVVQVATRPAHPPLRTWFPWVAVAATGIVIVSSAILVREQRQNHREHSENNADLVAKTTVPAPALPDKPAPTTQTDLKATRKKSAPIPAPKVAPPSQKSPDTMAAYSPQARAEEAQGLQPNPAPIAGPVAGGISQAQGANRALSTPSPLAFSNASQASVQTEDSSNRAARPQWRINALGQAERSYGGGAWQVALPEEKMHVVAVFGNEVWTGGEKQRLFHSSDDGTTWNSVTLPARDGRGHTITHIRFQTPKEGTVEAEDGGSWITTDGGKTWK